MLQRRRIVAPMAGIVALVIAACGGGEATAPPPPTQTPPTQVAPTATLVPASPTATASPAPGPTATLVRASPTTTASPATPAPGPVTQSFDLVLMPKAQKLGGTLQLPVLPGVPRDYDTFQQISGNVGEEIWHSVLSSLIVPDVYAAGTPLKGDVAERWEYGGGGKTLTFFIRRGIRFHDGDPLDADDVVYNIDRARTPRDIKTKYFESQLRPIEAVKKVDQYTVRVELATPSNALLAVLARNAFMMYPSHVPFPDRLDDWKKNPIGTGPFKVRDIQPGVNMKVVRHGDYFYGHGLPYLDGIAFTAMQGQLVVAGFRAGRLDATNFNSNELTPDVVNTLKREVGWVSYAAGQGPSMLTLNQRPPWTDKRVREALHLALDRQALVDIYRSGAGSALAAPLLAPEMGGKWGLPQSDLAKRPGYGDKKVDRAKALELIKEAGIDLGLTVTVLSGDIFPDYGTIVDDAVRFLGFKTNLILAPTVESTARILRGDFDVYTQQASIGFDDPVDYLMPYVLTGGVGNVGKWSDPRIDQRLADQDRELDETKRVAMLHEVQRIILDEHFGAYIPAIMRVSFVGHQRWVKNYYTYPVFNRSPLFRWDQVWLDK